jgi:SWI/SNF-related matrix-associated actin-dependent regulator of chromatin subfamily A-like protein 1
MKILALLPTHPNAEPLFGVSHYPFSKILQATAFEIPGVKWDRGAGAYIGYRDGVATLVDALAARKITRIDDLHLLTRKPAIPFNYAGIAKKSRNGDELRPYQLEGVEFLLARRSAVLADTMGLGKSSQALIAARACGGRLLIIAPNSVKGVWHNDYDGGEIKKWYAGKHNPTIYFPAGTKNTTIPTIPDSPDVIVIHFELVSAWADALIAWGPRVIVIDEAHIVYGRESKRAEAISRISQSSGVRHVWALTGTPMTNRPRDIYGLVETISPGRFGGEFFLPFGKRYCAGHQEEIRVRGGETKTVWKFEGVSGEGELAKRLATFTLRRTLSDVGLQLPPKIRQVVWLDVPGGADNGADVPTDKRAIQLALQRAADRKLPLALERVSELLEEGKVVVAFCYRREVAEKVLQVAKGPAWLVHGGIPASRRVDAIERAREAARVARAGEDGVLLAVTIDTCGTGINLSFCDVAAFVEATYEPHKLLQAEARVSRQGATRGSLMLYLMGRGTIDERVVDVVVYKLDEVFAKVFGADGSTGGLSSDLTGAVDGDIIKEIMAIGG